jgi:hypothetical protein
MSMLLRRYHEKAEESLARPAASASKADWAAYAVQEGHDVEGLKKDDIVALFAEPEPDSEEPVETDEETPDSVDESAETE